VTSQEMLSESNKSPESGGDDSSVNLQLGTEDSGASDTNNSLTRCSSHDPPRAVCPKARPGLSLNCNDNPDDDTDEDLANIPLDYGRSEGTKVLRLRIQNRWQT
jgi:hypothetical protein